MNNNNCILTVLSQCIGSSPPWFPAGPDLHRQWAAHRAAQRRRDSGSYTFTDLARMVVDNVRESNSPSK